jgi:cellulose synthase (UDP-forming)
VEIPGAAPSTAIAQAVRRHGDVLPVESSTWRSVVSGAYVVVGLAYIGWMMASLDLTRLWIAVPFALANLLTLTYGLLLVVNGWRREVPARRPLPYGAEPLVAVIIPTCGEPVPMILRTVESVLQQDWPLDRMVIVVSDDGHDPELEAAIRSLDIGAVEYYSAPPRDAPGRDGAAKAGNLNAALTYVCDWHSEAEVIETRDADDELGSPSFLREVVGQLHAHPDVAFVQTIKEASVSARDPFNNRESLFYRGQMLSKHAANAVFSCGSGVVWRRVALYSIGDFPTWNLVEDLQSGVDALRRGWRGMYLPIVGAVAQHAPEDLPSVFKQRGTWATDSVRLMVWGRLRGLSLRQRMHFWEIALCYLNSFTVPVYLGCLVVAMVTGVGPLSFTPWTCAVFMGSLIVVSELWLVVSFYPYNDRRRRQRAYFRSVWRARVVWNGLAPAYMKGAFRAVVGGPNRKPVYRVTRKTHDHRFHWRYVLPHATALVALVAASAYAVVVGSLTVAVVPALYWSALAAALLAGFISRGWFAVRGAPSAARARPAGHGVLWRPVRVLSAAAAVGAVALFGLPFASHSDASDAMYAFSTNHHVGVPNVSPVIRMAWRPRTGVQGYSVSWSRLVSSEPDAVRDLSGSAAGVESPPLVPGRWWFNLRADAADGWTSAVHIGPFVVAGLPVQPSLIPSTAFARQGRAPLARPVSRLTRANGGADRRGGSAD